MKASTLLVAGGKNDSLEVLWEDAERVFCKLWRDDTVAWLKLRWGDALASVVEHVDEPFAHFHFLLVPKLDHDRRLRIGTGPASKNISDRILAHSKPGILATRSHPGSSFEICGRENNSGHGWRFSVGE